MAELDKLDKLVKEETAKNKPKDMKPSAELA